jgi:hypothetical protein
MLRKTGQILLAASVMALVASASAQDVPAMPAGDPTLLTDPYLQNAEETKVSVVWMTNFEGRRHTVILSRDRENRRAPTRFSADTIKIEKLLDDSDSALDNPPELVSQRQVYRHEAVITDLTPGSVRSYRVVSVDEEGGVHYAGPFELEPAPQPGEPIEILLTSDMQERWNVLPNYERVAEMFPDLEAVFFAGDIVNTPYRASEWFDADRASWDEDPTGVRDVSFFPAMQGYWDRFVPTTPSPGGQILQSTPLYPSIGNHEVSGRFRPNATFMAGGRERTADIGYMDNDPQPRWYAEWRYNQVANTVNPAGDPELREQWIRDNSNDFETYRDLWTLPDDGPEGESYYVKMIGDVALISMNASRIWRTWNIRDQDRGKFREFAADFNNPEEWGFGDHIFTPFHEGSVQHTWLEEALQREDVQNARYRVVMAHQTMFGVGDNAVPVQTNPQLEIVYRSSADVLETKIIPMPDSDEGQAQTFDNEVVPLLGSIEEVRWEYPLTEDFWLTDIEPLLKQYDVDLVHTGHSHVWNRARSGDLDYIETSNVGNCFGAFWTDEEGTPNNNGRVSWAGSFWSAIDDPDDTRYDGENYPRWDDPHGREAVFPNLLNPEQASGEDENAVPYVCSNRVSVFTILDTGMGAVRSFWFDARDPQSETVEFDRLMLDD